MPRPLVSTLRIALVIVAVGAAAWMVDWRTSVVVPAGEPGLGLDARDSDTTYLVESMREAGPDAVLVTTRGGLQGEVGLDQIRPGMLTTLADADWQWVLIGLGLVGLIYPLQATRWWLLMRCRGLGVSWPRTLRLVFIGAFSNFCLPGTEGGDIVKAWAVAKGTGRSVESIMSVVFDRITGLAGLAILAAVVGIFLAESPQSQAIGWWVGAAMGVIGTAAIALFITTQRGWLRMPEVVRRFGGGLPGRVFGAAQAYASHPASVAGATGVSIIVQTLLASAAGCCAWALGARHELLVILAAMPIIFLAAAVPLSIQGAGIMELLAVSLLAGPGVASVNQAIGIVVLYRVLELGWAIVGIPLMLRSGIALKPPPEGVNHPV